jgi:hypothetical protein
MSLTTETLSSYLGRKALVLLSDAPFKNWAVIRTVEVDLDSPLIDYVFTQNGMDFVCDGEDKLSSIFLYADQLRYFREGVEDLPFTCTRKEVIARLGSPSRSGNRINDPILGDYGAWDRFERSGYVIHVEYRLREDAINKLTLMRTDVVPRG